MAFVVTPGLHLAYRDRAEVLLNSLRETIWGTGGRKFEKHTPLCPKLCNIKKGLKRQNRAFPPFKRKRVSEVAAGETPAQETQKGRNKVFRTGPQS